MRSPGERLRAGARDLVALEPELGQQRPRLLLRHPALLDEGVDQRVRRRRSRARAWSSVPIRTPGPIQRVPAASARWPIRASTSVVLPEPLGPTSATRSPHASSRSSGPRTKVPRRSSRAVEPDGDVAGALAAAEAQLQLPALPRLLDHLQALDRLLASRAPWTPASPSAPRAVAHELVRLGAGGGLGLRRRVSAHWRWRARAVGQAVALRGEGLVALLGVAGGGRAQLEVARPAAAVLRRGVGDLVDLEHAGDRAGEERAVVGDDHGAAGALGDEALEPGEAVEVEVVGRLVEQQDVEAAEQDRGQRGARGLAARERDGLQVEQRRVEAEVAQDGLGARLEVGAAELQPGLEGLGVAVGGAGRVRRQPAVAACTRASASATPVRRAR